MKGWEIMQYPREPMLPMADAKRLLPQLVPNPWKTKLQCGKRMGNGELAIRLSLDEIGP